MEGLARDILPTSRSSYDDLAVIYICIYIYICICGFSGFRLGTAPTL